MFSWLPGLPTLKTWGIGIASFVSVVFFALWKNSEAKRAKEMLAGSEAARDVENRVNKSLVEGLQNEKDSHDNIDYNDPDRLV